MSLSEVLLDVRDVHRGFGGATRTEVVRGVSLCVRHHEIVAIVGPSGSGKSSLLNLLGLLDRPDSGQIVFDGVDPWSLSPASRAHLRLTRIGFVFQQHHLLPFLTARDNVALPLWRASNNRRAALLRADALLDEVAMTHRAHAKAGLLSVGEAQRVAVARSLANEPALLLADEPTGALDSVSTAQVTSLLRDLAGRGRALLLVTHDPGLAAQAERTIVLRDGQLAQS